MSAYAKLRRRRQIFVDAYVRTGNGTEAALATGYSAKAPHVAANKMLANPEVRAAVAERQQEAIERAGARQVKYIETLCYRTYVALAALRGEDGKVLTFDKMPAELLSAAESIEFNPDGSVKRMKLATSAATRMLGEVMKAFTQVHEIVGKDGGPIETHEVSDLEKARRMAYVLAQGLRAAQPPATVLTESLDDDKAMQDMSKAVAD